MGLGFQDRAGRYRPGDLRFRPTVVGDAAEWNDLGFGDVTLSFPGAAGPRRCPEGQLSPRAGSMGLSQSAMSHQPVLLVFPHGAGWFRPGGSPFISPDYQSCRCMERVLIRDGILSSPRCSGFIYEHQPISNGPVGLGLEFHTVRGGVDLGEIHFPPRVVGV